MIRVLYRRADGQMHHHLRSHPLPLKHEHQHRNDDEPTADAEQPGDQTGEGADQKINDQDIHGMAEFFDRYTTSCNTASA